MIDQDEQTETDAQPEPVRDDREGLLTYLAGLIGLALVTIAAAAGRLLALDRYPGGLLDAEARHGVLARESRDFGVRWLIEGAGELSIPLTSLIMITGRLTEFDATTPRIAAALCGAGSVFATGLWLRRDLGPLWGLAGAAVLAGSFWHILFSRLALGQIAGAMALAALLWFLSEASARRGSQAMPWYALAGLAVGTGFLATPSLRLLPFVLLGVLGVSLYRHLREEQPATPLNWLIATSTAYLIISPYLIATRSDTALWTPWARTPGLPGDDPVTVPEFPGALIQSFTSLLLPTDSAHGLNLPADAWFSLFMLPWAVIGLLGVISLSNNPVSRDRFLVGTVGLVGLWIGISAVDAGHPGQLVVISPLLAGLVIAGFRTAVNWARMPTVRVVLLLLIVTGIAGEAVVSTDRYLNEWADSPETRSAMNVSTVDALQATVDLGTDEPVFISLTGHDDLLTYFVTPVRRHPFDGATLLPFPVEENGYALLTDNPPLHPSLEDLLGEVPELNFSLDEGTYQAYRLDQRVRQQIPFSVPTVSYPDGLSFQGSQLVRTSENVARVLIAWNTPEGSPGQSLDVRLQGVGEATSTSQQTVELPANPLMGRLYQVLAVDLEIPDGAEQGDLSVRLRDAQGQAITTSGVDQDGFLHLDRYAFPE